MKVKCPSSTPGLKLGLSMIIILVVVSAPIVTLVNPALAQPSSTDGNTLAPSTISQDGGDFTTQAALSLTRASQTNNFVASKAYYDISFRTATAGVIKSVVMDFPTGTSVGSALVVEATGIGPGTLAASAGEVLTYTVTNAVNVPANTIIRIQISNINNPPTPSASLTVSITTMDAVNMPIDGPTPTLAYNMVQVGNAQIAPGAITTTKIATGAVTSGDVAPSFIRSRALLDGQNGWIPDDSEMFFFIDDVTITANSHIFTGHTDASGPVLICSAGILDPGFGFLLDCDNPPSDGTTLRYTIIDQPNT